MAKIPDETALGARPTPRVGRGLPGTRGGSAGLYRAASAFSRYAQVAGSGLEAIGEAVKGIGKTREALAEKNNRMALSRAVSEWKTRLIELDQKYSEDQEFATIPERYRDEVNKLGEGLVGGLPDSQTREAFDNIARIDGARGFAAMQDKATIRANDATRAWLGSSLETRRRSYLEAEDDNGRINALEGAEADIGTALAQDAIDQEQAAKIFRGFRVQSATDRISMMSDADQVAVLANDNFLTDDIDPADRAKMLKAARSRLDAGVRADVLDAVMVLDAGKIPSNLASVERMAKGTKYEADLRGAVRDREAVLEFIQSPVQGQSQKLKEFADKETSTADEVSLYGRYARANASIIQGLQRGQGLLLGGDAGIIGAAVEIDLDDPATLRARAIQAETVSQWAGTPVSPLMPHEADWMAVQIDEAEPGAVVGMLQTLNRGLGRDAAILVAGDVAPKRPELSAAIVLAPDAPIVARDIVLGGRALTASPDVKPVKVDRITAVEEVVGNMLTPESAPVLDSFMDAATALYAGRKIPTGDLNYDADDFEQALRDVMGGPIEFNGRVILPPRPFMSENDFEDVMEGLKQPDLIEFGNGVPVFADGAPFTVDLFDRWFTDAELVSSGFGTYLIFMDGLGYVQRQDGGAYELDLRRLLDVRP